MSKSLTYVQSFDVAGALPIDAKTYRVTLVIAREDGEALGGSDASAIHAAVDAVMTMQTRLDRERARAEVVANQLANAETCLAMSERLRASAEAQLAALVAALPRCERARCTRPATHCVWWQGDRHGYRCAEHATEPQASAALPVDWAHLLPPESDHG